MMLLNRDRRRCIFIPPIDFIRKTLPGFITEEALKFFLCHFMRDFFNRKTFDIFFLFALRLFTSDSNGFFTGSLPRNII